MGRFAFRTMLKKDPGYSDEVQMRLLRLLYDNLYSASLVIFFNATLFAYVVWPAVSHRLLATWYALLMTVTLLRFLDTYSFFRQTHHDCPHWYRRFSTGVILSALLWGAVPLLFFPQGQPIY